jgi:hypothetical protein
MCPFVDSCRYTRYTVCMALTFLAAALLVVAVLWYEGERLLHFIHWAQDSNHRPRIVAERSVGDSEHIEVDSVVFPPPPVEMPPGRSVLSDDVVRHRYTHYIAQTMAAVRAEQVAAAVTVLDIRSSSL